MTGPNYEVDIIDNREEHDHLQTKRKCTSRSKLEATNLDDILFFPTDYTRWKLPNPKISTER